jgi:transcriptional regulator with XRE-family HTH domain
MSLRRIAAEAGVSPSTVSLALRQSPKIPAGTRARILKIAKRLGYRPEACVLALEESDLKGHAKGDEKGGSPKVPSRAHKTVSPPSQPAI